MFVFSNERSAARTFPPPAVSHSLFFDCTVSAIVGQIAISLLAGVLFIELGKVVFVFNCFAYGQMNAKLMFPSAKI